MTRDCSTAVDAECVLTTDHAASSYGLPVVVSKTDGAVYGPAECGAVNTGPIRDEDDAGLHAAAVRAGYEIYA